MKRIYLFLLGLLFVCVLSASDFVYTPTVFSTNFDADRGPSTNELIVGDTAFRWISVDYWFTATFQQTGGELTITDGAMRSGNLYFYLDSFNIDVSAMPYMLIEAKGDTTLEEHIFVKDGSGGGSDFDISINLTPTYQSFVIGLSGVGNLDVSDITSLKFNNTGTSISAANDNLYIKHLAIGDTTKTVILIDNNEIENEELVCYPNPVQNKLNVSGIEGIRNAVITDLTGKVLMVIDAAEVADGIDVAGLASGMYIISIETANGKLDEIFIKE